jgi:hypothetical protein
VALGRRHFQEQRLGFSTGSTHSRQRRKMQGPSKVQRVTSGDGLNGPSEHEQSRGDIHDPTGSDQCHHDSFFGGRWWRRANTSK